MVIRSVADRQILVVVVVPTSLKERSTDRPWTLARPSSTRLMVTMMLSKMFQPT